MSESARSIRLPRVDTALSACDSHLSSGALVSPPIQSLLTQALLLLIFREFERSIRSQIKKRCSGAPDAIAANFVASAADDMIGGFKIKPLANLLGHFDAECKDAFRSNLKQETKDQHNSLVNNRNQVAHGGELTPTLVEVKEYHRHTQVVLEHFQYALFRGVDDAADTGDEDR